MLDSTKSEAVPGLPLSPSIHPHVLFAANADARDIYDELAMKMAQARGMVGLLTQLDPADLIEAPNNALGQQAWAIDEQLEAIDTLARMLLERYNAKATQATATQRRLDALEAGREGGHE